MLDLASINTAPGAAKLTVASPAKDDSLAASVGPTTTVTSTGPDLWHRLWGKDGFSFATVLDIVNPLQHIPVVSTVYQKLTGDVASPGANIVGGALFGGPVGLALATLDSSLKGETGKDMGGHVLALFDSGTTAPGETAPGETAVASAGEAALLSGSPSHAAATADASSASEKPETPEDATVAAAAPAVPPPAQVAEAATNATDATAKPADKTAADTESPKSAFVLAHSAPRSYSGKGVGNAFVPLETRSTIMPAAYFAAPPAGGTVVKSDRAGAPFPDPKALAANPALLHRFQASRTASPFAPPANVPGAASASDAAAAAADPSGFAALMARNLERYMTLQNTGTAPKINKQF